MMLTDEFELSHDGSPAAQEAFRLEIPDGFGTMHKVAVQCVGPAGEFFYQEWKAAWVRDGLNVVEKQAPEGIGSASGNQEGYAAILEREDREAVLTVTGEGRWTVLLTRMQTAAPAIVVPGEVPAVALSISPSWGTEDGGTTVLIEVADSSEIDAVKIGGVAATALAVISPTLMRCVTGPGTVGLADVVLSNEVGDSAPLEAGFLYFDPTDAHYAPSHSFVAPEYDDRVLAPRGTWTKRTGTNLTTGGVLPTPVAVAGAPKFNGGTTNPLVNPSTVASWFGAGNRHAVAVLDVAGIANNDTGNTYGNAAVFVDTAAIVGLTLYRTSTGPYTYFATFFDYDGGFKKATVDITSLVDANGAGTLVLEGKKTGGRIYIRANGGAWVDGGLCGNTANTTGTLQVGRGYGGAKINGTIRAILLTNAAKDAAYSALIQDWAPRVPSGWARRTTHEMPSDFITRMSCATFTLASGRLLIVGGFCPAAGAPWNNQWVTNEVWASDDQGDTWTKLLAHVTDPPTTGPTARFRPTHSVPFCTMNGVAYLAGVDPTFQTTGSGDVWRSEDGETWTLVTATAPCLGRTMAGMGAIGSTLYMGGGQGATLDESTRIRDWHKSEDGGATWTEMALPPWSARGMMYNLPTIGGKIYLVGGGVYDNGPLLGYNGVYSFDGTDWVEVLPDGHTQWTALLYSVPCAMHGRLWLFNGYDNATTADVYRALYSDDFGATWHEFLGGAGGAAGGPSHADTVVAGETRMVRLQGYSSGSASGRAIHTFAPE